MQPLDRSSLSTIACHPQAVKENLDTLLPILPKILQLIKTATCDHKADASGTPTA